ncbi:MAG: endonuclease/exonuclease/phosphatase family protein [Aulosira sp. ZfuVER01]|nr:endonuclease/exonuclease/phosphatase family protein [Aulosira sp. ZfuVER01]MDZ7999467.1 endonuclease/exonuclease/phosphatase family protein [Aulosira sp. DedVER01a]MDZ8054753.1 endonuclease/exonuclease/phosphatase family protein [Aulosira sp. ZfuCHP01]
MELESIIRNLRKIKTWIVAFVLLASLSFGVVVFAADDDQDDATLRVMTQNLFMGTDFPELIAAKTSEEFIQAVTTTYNNVIATKPAERMAAIAQEIAQRKPDLIGLQEAAILRTGSPAATNVKFDMLQILLGELNRLRQPYTAVAILLGLDAEAPSSSEELGNVRFTVQDVILVRNNSLAGKFRLSNVQTSPYKAQLTVPTAIGPITNVAGWAAVDGQAGGRGFRFVTTHLAITPNFDATIALAQAQELRDTAGNTSLPVVFVGDFNSVASDRNNPTFATYKSFLDAGFAEIWLQTRSVDPGFTCCQSPNVRNSASSLSQRIDLIFVRGQISGINASLVGDKQNERTPSGLWPSDHAGVIAKLNGV